MPSLDAPDRILGDVVGALSRVSAVRTVASFGSIAERRADLCSDVDLFVGCDAVERSAWVAAAAIRAAKPVAFYRAFTGVEQPSGRYWFADEQPFNRLDVTFYSTTELEAVCRDGRKEGLAIVARLEHAADGPVDLDANARSHPPSRPVVVPSGERAADRWLLRYLEALKRERRGRGSPNEIAEARAELARALAEGAGTPPGLEHLARRVLALE
jgi:hypothetical protein